MQQININELKQHPRNSEFFDDMTGEKWNEFLASVKSRGVIEPIVITPDKVIVSGHQRVRACKELGITSVMCDVHTYNSEDEVLQDLLETNIRQRGDVGGSAKKVGLRIKELERIYGIEHGNNQYTGGQEINSSPKTQSDLAAEMDMDVRTLRNYKILADMIPELETLVDTGKISKTAALAVIKKVSPEEQKALFTSLVPDKRYTKEEVDAEIQKYKDKVQELESKKPEVVEKEVEKIVYKPDPSLQQDYDRAQETIRGYKEDYQNLTSQFKDKVAEVQDLRKQIETLKRDEATEQYSKKLKTSAIFFCAKVKRFIEEVGGYVWLTDYLNELPEDERQGYIKAAREVNNWSNALLQNIEG